jgi:hypothetical protein
MHERVAKKESGQHPCNFLTKAELFSI